MGQRANLAIGNASGYELFYSHWCANTLPRDLFWGSGHALQFISQQQSVTSGNGWLDTVWAEGGAVVDPPNKTLLLYGGEDLLYDVPLRRLYLKLLKVAWGDWNIRWAYEGIIDIAEYLGVDREHVTAEAGFVDEMAANLTPPQERSWLRCIGTFKTDNGVKIYPLDGLPIDYLLMGSKLVGLSDQVQSWASLNVSEWTADFPTGGFHVDLDQKQLDFWLADDCPNVPIEVAKTWDDWNVNWHKDCFESHLSLAGSALVFNQRSQSSLLFDLLAMLDQESKPIDVLKLAERLSEQQGGQHVEVNRFALLDSRLSVAPESRKAILARCLAAFDE